MRWAKRSWCAGLGASLFVAAAPAAADVPTRLVYVRTQEAAACPDQAALQKAVEARLGHDPFSIWGENTIIATVSARGGALRARAELVDGAGVLRGSRDVVGRASDCDELILALALAISITLDPMHSVAPRVAEGEGEAATATEPEALPPTPQPRVEPLPRVSKAPQAAATAKAARRTTSLRGHAAVFATLGSLPAPVAGGRAGVSFERGAFLGGLEMGGTLSASGSSEAGGRVVLSLVSASLFPCVAFVRGLFGCALGSVGSFRGHGEGVTDPKSAALAYAAVGGRIALRLPLSTSWAFSFDGDLLGTLTRPTFNLNGAAVWRPPPVSGALGIGLSLRLS